jgi:hypothetical protein
LQQNSDKKVCNNPPTIVDYVINSFIILQKSAKSNDSSMEKVYSDFIQVLKELISMQLSGDQIIGGIGDAATGYLIGFNTIGVMPVGTGLGFTVWRNGRKWTPNISIPLLECTYTPSRYYDKIASTTALTDFDKDKNLSNIFLKDEFLEVREIYIKDLSGYICTSFLVYGKKKNVNGGGMAEAVNAVQFPLVDRLKEEFKKENFLSSGEVQIEVMPEGNTLPLIGTALLAIGEERARITLVKKEFAEINTEMKRNFQIIT